MNALPAALFAAFALAASATVPAGTPGGAPAGPWTGAPRRLADTGLYADASSRAIAADVLPFAPQYPLWTDGAQKRRWIRLPPGTAIDATNPDVWSFPVGTRIWKEFAFERAIETRYLERRADGEWTFATYLWNAAGTDAVLAPERGVRGAAHSSPGVRYDVPGRLDCQACHHAGPNRVLGFSALQLSTDRDPLAPHAEPPPPGAVDLAALLDRGLVRGLPEEFTHTPPRIDAPTPRARAALGYLHANCGSCHAGGGALDQLDFALDYPLAARDAPPPALRTALGVPSRFQLPAHAARARIAPGDPDESLLVRRMASRNPLLQMPPLGTHARDEVALELLTAWIRADVVPAGTARSVDLPTSQPTPTIRSTRP